MFSFQLLVFPSSSPPSSPRLLPTSPPSALQLAASKRLLDLASEEAEETKAKLRERDAELEALRGAIAELQAKSKDALDARKRAQEEAEAEVRALRAQIADPASYGTPGGALVPAGAELGSTGTPGGGLSPLQMQTPGTWRAMSEFQKYEKYAALEERVREESRQR